MTPEEFANKMRNIIEKCNSSYIIIAGEPHPRCDAEDIHYELDMCMCDLLRELGYGEGVDVFLAQERWYA